MNRVSATGICISLTLLLQACSGGSNNTPPTSDTPSVAAVTSPGKVLLGPVANASIQVFSLEAQDTPLCETASNGGTDLETAGNFEIPAGCISPGMDYLIIATGGQDLDADDDGVLDETSTTVNGQVRALLSTEELSADGWKISALTESVYQSVKFHLDGADRETIENLKKSAATTLLSESRDSDNDVSYSDILQWDPREHNDKLKDKTQVDDLLRTIHNGDNKPQLPDTSSIEGFDYLNIDASIHTAKIAGNIALLGTGSNLLLVDITPGKDMRIIKAIANLTVRQIETRANLVYVATGVQGLQIYDIQDPENPTKLSTIDGTIQALAWHGQTLLATAERDETVDIIRVDVSDPAAPELIKRQTLAQPARYSLMLAEHAGYLYAFSSGESVFDSFLGIYDLSQSNDVLNSTAKISFDISARIPPNQMGFDGNTLFLKSYEYVGQKTIYRYDVSDPASPVALSDILLTDDARAMHVSHDALYQMDTRQLNILQMPGLGTFAQKTLPIDYAGFEYQEGYAYLFGNTLGRLKLPDVERASTTSGKITIAPLADATINLYRHGNSEAVCSGKSSGGTLHEAGTVIFDLGCVQEQGYYLISVEGGKNLDANRDGIIDTSPSAFTGSLHALITADELLAGNWAINEVTELAYRSLKPVLDGLDDSNLAHNLKRIAGKILSNDITSDASIDNNDLLRFNAEDNNRSFILGVPRLNEWRQDVMQNSDTSDHIETLAFTPLYSLPIDSNFFGTNLSGDSEILVVLDLEELTIYGTSNTIGLRKLSHMKLEGASKQILYNDYLYVAYNDGTLEVYDISDPGEPRVVSTMSDTVFIPSQDGPSSMRVYQDNLLLVSKDSAGGEANFLHIIDISSPELPALRSTTDLQNDLSIMDIEIHNQHLYLVSMYAGFAYSDLKDRLDIYELDNLDNPLNKVADIHYEFNNSEFESSHGISISFNNNLAYLFASNFMDASKSHIRVYDISNPASPIHLDTLFEGQANSATLVHENGMHSWKGSVLRSYALPTLLEARVADVDIGGPFTSHIEIIGQYIYLIGNSLSQLPLPTFPTIDSLQGEIVIGRIAGANVTIHSLDNRNGAALCSAVSSDELDLLDSGRVTLPLSCTDNGGLFIVSSSGGNDIDNDNDGVRDTVPSVVAGTMRAIVSANELTQPGWRLSPMSEAAYQLVANQLDTINSQDLIEKLNIAAAVLLDTDLNSDGEINRKDLLYWNPRAHNAANTHYDTAGYENLINSIRNDNTTALVASSLSSNIKAIVSADNKALNRLSASGNLLATSGEEASTQIYDITSGLALMSTIESSAEELLLEGNTLYLVSDGSLEVFDLSTPSAPQLQGSYAGVDANIHGLNVPLIWLQDSTLFAVSRITNPGSPSNYELLALDISDPTNINLRSQTALATDHSPWAIARNSTYLYMAMAVPGMDAFMGNATLFGWDLSDPNAPSQLGQSVDVSNGPYSNMFYHDNELILSTGSIVFPEQGCQRIALNNNVITAPEVECSLPGRSHIQNANTSASLALALPTSNGKFDTVIIDNLDTLDTADRQEVAVPAFEYDNLIVTGEKAYVLGEALIEITLP
jgi:hypothetical protein